MKKYFAKHIPVGGNIQNQDRIKLKTQYQNFPDNWFIAYEKDKGKFMLKAPSFTDEYFKLNFFENEARIKDSQYLPENLQKVKLFLCSRDITNEDILIEGRVHLYFEPKNKNEEVPFKIIGEISPEALYYVKEGDEFDEENIRFTKVKDESIIETYDFGMPVFGTKIIAKILGPCGNFH